MIKLILLITAGLYGQTDFAKIEFCKQNNSGFNCISDDISNETYDFADPPRIKVSCPSLVSLMSGDCQDSNDVIPYTYIYKQYSYKHVNVLELESGIWMYYRYDNKSLYYKLYLPRYLSLSKNKLMIILRKWFANSTSITIIQPRHENMYEIHLYNEKEQDRKMWSPTNHDTSFIEHILYWSKKL